MKLKHYWFSVTQGYLNDNNINFVEVLQSHKTIKKWAYILHDRDNYTKIDELKDPTCKYGEPKPAHVHIYLNFGESGVQHELVARWFNVNPHSIKKIETNAANCLLYFVHGTEDSIAEGKYQYSWGEVRHSPNWNPQLFTEEERFVGYLGRFDEFSYKQQIEKIHEVQDLKVRLKLQKQLDEAYLCEMKYRATFIDRFVQVMFVTGDSGAGKTIFSRQFTEKLNYFDIVPERYWRKSSTDNDKRFRHVDYAISSASNDVFENYKGEDVFILDDMRDNSFCLSDLLKFLDNHTNSLVKSRFTNKCFFGALIIITSKTPLKDWYKNDIENVSRADLGQLYRRISNYVVVKKDKIYLFNSVNEYGEPDGDCKVIKNNTSDYYKDNPKPVNVSNLICDMFEEVKPEVIKNGQISMTEVLDEDELPF